MLVLYFLIKPNNKILQQLSAHNRKDSSLTAEQIRIEFRYRTDARALFVIFGFTATGAPPTQKLQRDAAKTFQEVGLWRSS